MGHESKGFSLTIAEMREFAAFTASEQEFIERSLDIALGRCDAFKVWSQSIADQCAIRGQYIAYRELKQLRALVPDDDGFDGLETFMGTLTRISAQDLALGRIESFSAYRFLYERLLGAAVRPYLPAAFCGAAALPQVAPATRRQLLQSLSEAAATAPGWSRREPAFYPERVEVEAA
ncbi:hypothetical protein [Aurantiacibacter gangjinensis]|uniref:Uncharacterized protein n=1 Tax=Aurantiacibacter gangjinensis TaxID=502682 RepID=A0A0G9MLG6_9SPHN|nr:hypothetical protein [Aurantiacibacter gangjinensis]APE27478.1 hypothetical protein BMF35_a0649 [Aurantiacibacter gangjinensis]KLE31542.1 hypothetical protein AAW01_08225 [Aurantiacibacter gangjinensis]